MAKIVSNWESQSFLWPSFLSLWLFNSLNVQCVRFIYIIWQGCAVVCGGCLWNEPLWSNQKVTFYFYDSWLSRNQRSLSLIHCPCCLTTAPSLSDSQTISQKPMGARNKPSHSLVNEFHLLKWTFYIYRYCHISFSFMLGSRSCGKGVAINNYTITCL